MNYVGRLLFFILFLWAATQAWAGIAYQHGQAALQNKDSHLAQSYFEEAARRGFKFPELYAEHAHTVYLNAMQSKKAEDLKRALMLFQKAHKELPLKGKYLVYEARLQLELLRLNQKLNQSSWQEVKVLLTKAYDLKGSNLWIPFQVAKVYLSHIPFLNEAEIKWAYTQLKNPCLILPGYYLEPALEFLNSRNVSAAWMNEWLPKNYKVYRLAVEAFERMQAWDYWQTLYPDYLLLEKREAASKLAQAQSWIAEGYVEKVQPFLKRSFIEHPDEVSFVIYEKLIQYQMKQLGRSEKTQLEKSLREFLQKDGMAKPFDHFAKTFVHYSQDKLLQALYAYRTEDYEGAVKSFALAQNNDSDIRFMYAMSLIKTGQKDMAVTVLKKTLEDEYSDIDLKNLDLLEQLRPDLSAEIEAFKKENVVHYRPASAWAHENGHLRHGTQQGTVISVEPGKSWLFFSVRKQTGVQGDIFVVLRLHNRYVTSFWIQDNEWRPIRVPLQTEGGRFWLALDVMSHPDGETVAELGELRIKT